MTSNREKIEAEKLLLSNAWDGDFPFNLYKIAKYLGITVTTKFIPPTIADVKELAVIGMTDFRNKRDKRLDIQVSIAETRKRFLIAHSLGHYVLNHNNYRGQRVYEILRDISPTVDSQTEASANKFALELLMPTNRIVETSVWKLFKDKQTPATRESLTMLLTKEFNVSVTAARAKMRTLLA